jgi:hypothetical protein
MPPKMYSFYYILVSCFVRRISHSPYLSYEHFTGDFPALREGEVSFYTSKKIFSSASGLKDSIGKISTSNAFIFPRKPE